MPNGIPTTNLIISLLNGIVAKYTIPPITREQQCWCQIQHLTKETYMNQLAGIVSINYQTKNRCENRADTHAQHSRWHTEDNNYRCNNFLDNFQLQEQVTPAFHLQQVQVDGMHGKPHQREAKHLQIGHTLGPLIRHQAQH